MRVWGSVVSLAVVFTVAGSSLPAVAESAAVGGLEASPEMASAVAVSPVELVPPAPAKLGQPSTAAVDPRVPGRPERVRELVRERTATSSTFAMSDGSEQLVLSAAPVHYRDDEGVWRKVDTRVEPGDGANAFVSDTNVFGSEFGRSTDRLVELEADGYTVRLGVAGDAERVVPSASGSTVRFADLFGSADVRYAVSSEGVKEDIVLEDANAVAESYAEPPRSFRTVQVVSLYPAGRVEFLARATPTNPVARFESGDR